MQEHDPPRTLIFHPATRSVVYFGPFRLDLSDGLLTRSGEEVRLPPRALTILQHLVERAGRIVSKQSLMDVAWKDAHVSETSLTEAVGLIRQALGDDSQKPEFIQTVHRRGYRFVAPIATEPAAVPPQVDRSRPSEPVAHPGEPSPTSATRPGTTAARRRGSIRGDRRGAAGRRALDVDSPSQPRKASQWSVSTSRFLLAQAPVPSVNAHPIVTVSPDGQRIVYVGGEPDKARLFLREMNRFDAVPLPGTEGAHGPFFSPDGDWVAFFRPGHAEETAHHRRATNRTSVALRDRHRRRRHVGVGQRDRVRTELAWSADARPGGGRETRSLHTARRHDVSLARPARRSAPSLPHGGDRRPTTRRSWPSR